ITRGTTTVAGTNQLDVIKDGVSFSSIDFSKSKLDPLGFALQEFKIDDPATADEQKLADELDVYLGLEFFLRQAGGSTNVVERLKVPKFFLQFQLGRVQLAKGQKVTLAGGIEHQRQKVIKNARGQASAAEIAAVAAI
ncbi:hypothetical protein BDK51DRAFT_9993, partial [Blyttiomyces helicus]